MKIKKTIYTVVICDYNVDDGNRLYVNSDVYTDEKEAKERYEEAKKYLIDLASKPEIEYGGFPGQTFAVKVVPDEDMPQWHCIRCVVERVTDKPEERYCGEVHLSKEEVEIEDDNGFTGREKIVADIVSGILKESDLCKNKITEVLLDDYGNCIHVTLTGGVDTGTIGKIGREFGDSTPHVYGAGDDATKLVIMNVAHTELITDNEKDQ